MRTDRGRALLLALTGCTAAPQAQPAPTNTAPTTNESGFLPDHDSAGLDAVQIIDHLDQTHECHYHSLTTSRGEPTNELITVRITDDATGQPLLEEQVTTFDNGSAGFWLPRGITGTIEVTYARHPGQGAFSTSDEAVTCLTTLQLTLYSIGYETGRLRDCELHRLRVELCQRCLAALLTGH